MKKAVNIICSVLLVVAIMVCVLTFSIGLPIYIRPFYYLQIEPLGVPERTGHTVEEIRASFDEVMDYLTLPRKEFGTGVFKHSESGKAHFADCKSLFTLNACGLLISAAVIVCVWLSNRKKWIALPSLRGFGLPMVSGVSLLTLIVAAGIAVATDFSWAFTAFHTLFFPGKDNWLFNTEEDAIIGALPREFFLNCAILIGVSVLLCCAGLIVCGIVGRRKYILKDKGVRK